jgi:uncharacterized protein (TIGR02466 family)
MEKLDAFPISLGIDNIINFQEHKQTILKTTKKNKKVANDKSSSLKHYYAKDNNVLNDPNLSVIKNIIETKANDYYQEVLGYKENLYISDSWINICNKGGYQPEHYHSNCVVSGTLYVQLGNNYAPISFRNPRSAGQPLSPEIKSLKYKDTMYNLDWVAVQNIQEGAIIFWPSYLVHGYNNNQFDGRVSLSFNLNIKKSDFLYSSPFTEI